MKRLALFVTIVVLLGSIPPTMARHRSVGAEERVLVSPDDEPSVPDAGPSSPYQVGITPLEDCYDPDGEASQRAIEQAAAADGFCGSLIYNEQLPGDLEIVSAPDQHIPETIGGAIDENPIATFDVVRTDQGGFPGGFILCDPFCESYPASERLHEVFYDTGSEVGLTNDSETTDEKQRDNRENYVTVQTNYPNAGQLVQGQTGMWEMNGWTTLSPSHQFVAFVEDGDGNPISKKRLTAIVSNSDLPEGAAAKLCGYSADVDYGTTTADSSCELRFKYIDDDGSTGRSDFTEYGDRCDSPTYLCQPASGPAWKSFPLLYRKHFGTASRAQAPVVDYNYTGIYGNGDKYRTWHFVAAPSLPDCTAQEPGVSFAKGKASAPYLAHDLDVFTPITRIDGASTSSRPMERYADAATDRQLDRGFEQAGDALERAVDETSPVFDRAGEVVNDTEVPDPVEQRIDQLLNETNERYDQVLDVYNDTVLGTYNDTLALVGNATEPLDEQVRAINEITSENVGDVFKDDRIEPNANPANNPLADTSQHLDDDGLERSLDTGCERATSSETVETVDPWVEIVDSGISYTRFYEYTTYGNTDDNQDEDNNPGPTRFTTEGHIGLFTDRDDDGEYTYDPDDTYRAEDIINDGAYPMLWDMRVDKTGDQAQPTEDGTCNLGSNNIPLSTEMDRMGYGVNTGLFQLVYLQEPTSADTSVAATDERIVYSSGNNIYLLASQSVRELWDGEVDPGAADDFELDNKVDEAVLAMQAYADQKNGEMDPPGVEVPGHAFGHTSDFDNQCEAETGGFSSKISFTHNCKQQNCTGDTVLTRYVYEITNPSGQLVDGDFVPSFSGLSQQTARFSFGAGVHTWTDVDPFDGDPDRNDDTEERPPTAE